MGASKTPSTSMSFPFRTIPLKTGSVVTWAVDGGSWVVTWAVDWGAQLRIKAGLNLIG
jgi:hypothetical protein